MKDCVFIGSVVEKKGKKVQTKVYAFKVFTESGCCAGGTGFDLRAG